MVRPFVFGGVGVEDAGDVVFGVAGRKQHAGNSQHAGDALVAQLVEADVDDRVGELKVAVFDRVLRQAGAKTFGDFGEFFNGETVSAAVAADHDAQFFGHEVCLLACLLSNTQLRLISLKPVITRFNRVIQ